MLVPNNVSDIFGRRYCVACEDDMKIKKTYIRFKQLIPTFFTFSTSRDLQLFTRMKYYSVYKTIV